MGLFSRLQGTVKSFFNIGGPTGNALASGSQFGATAAIEAVNSNNTALVVVRGATPVGDSDLATKAYVDDSSRPFIVTAQSNADTATIPNSGSSHYIIVSASGTNYTFGTILFDNGTSSGNVEILGPTIGMEFVAAANLSGGTENFVLGHDYVWTGSTWADVTPSGVGELQQITVSIAHTAGAATSTMQIPSGAVVSNCYLTVGTAYAGGTSPTLAVTVGATSVMAAADNFPAVAGDYEADQNTAIGTSAVVTLTFAGTGTFTTGAATALVTYSTPSI